MEHKHHLERSMERKAEHYVKKAVKIFFFIILGLAFFILLTYVFMRLWNWLAPELFELQQLDYWQALGLLVLAKIIFGFGFGGDSDRPSKNRKKSKKSKNLCAPRRSFSDWKLYDEFWEAEGEQAFKDYVSKKKEK